MDIKTLKKILPYCFKAKIPLFVWGESGIGKSQIAREWAAENKYKFIDVRLGVMADQGDLCGMPYGKDEHGRTLYSKPWFFPVESDGPTLLFLDEFNRTPPQLLNGVFSLLLDGYINNNILPASTVTMAAGNPPTGDYNVTDIEKALLRRFVHFELRPQEHEFMDYARQKKFTAEIVEFLASSPKSIGYEHKPIQLGLEPHPRAWEALDRLFKILPKALWPDVVNGLIGFSTGAEFVNSLAKGDKPVKAKDVLSGYSKVKKEIKAQSNIDNKIVRADLLNETIADFKSVLFEDSDMDKPVTLTDAQLNNILAFLKDIPKEFMVAFTRTYFVSHPVLGDKIADDDEILKAIEDMQMSSSTDEKAEAKK